MTYFSSLDASGNSRFFFRSVRAINANNSLLSFTIGNFPIRTILLPLLPQYPFLLVRTKATKMFAIITITFIDSGVARGGEHRERSTPEIEKNCCRKMMLFPKALFLASTFSKIVEKSIFQLNFHLKFSKFRQKCSNNLCFSSKRAQSQSRVRKILCKIGKNKAF